MKAVEHVFLGESTSVASHASSPSNGGAVIERTWSVIRRANGASEVLPPITLEGASLG